MQKKRSLTNQTTKRDIVVFGCGGHAKVVIDIIEKSAEYNILGVASKHATLEDDFFGYKILNEDDVLMERDVGAGIVVIGDNWLRSQAVERILTAKKKFHFISAIHPSAIVAKHVQIDSGSVVMAGVVVNCGSRIGKHCIINTCSSLDHDNILGDFVSVAPNVSTGGGVRIGNFSAISIGVNVIHGINVGEHTVIGAGATVVKDVDSFVVSYGTPAKDVRCRRVGEEYL